MPSTYPTRLDMMKALLPPGSVICEVGVFKGEFASQLLSLKPQQLVCIDPFVGNLPSGDADGNNVKEVYLPLVYLSLTQQARRVPNLLLLRGYSQELLPHFAPDSFDAVYIDGDHSYEGVKRDLQLAWRVVKPGGFICGHDYETNAAKTKNHYDFGVKKAVDEFCIAKDVSIYAKGMDGQVSFAIKKDDKIQMYIDTSTPPLLYLKKKPQEGYCSESGLRF